MSKTNKPNSQQEHIPIIFRLEDKKLNVYHLKQNWIIYMMAS